MTFEEEIRIFHSILDTIHFREQRMSCIRDNHKGCHVSEPQQMDSHQNPFLTLVDFFHSKFQELAFYTLNLVRIVCGEGGNLLNLLIAMAGALKHIHTRHYLQTIPREYISVFREFGSSKYKYLIFEKKITNKK